MKIKLVIVFIGGIFFGFGLAFGGMAKQEIVLSFLQLKDLGLLLLLGGSAAVTALTINVIPKILKKPVLGGVFQKKEKNIDTKDNYWCNNFWVGWGLSGLCPGSAMASLGVGNLPSLIGIGGMFLGAYIMGRCFT